MYKEIEFERDTACLNDNGCKIIGTFKTTKGHVILWSDNKGATVSTCHYGENSSRSNGSALKLTAAWKEFTAACEVLLAPIAEFEKIVAGIK